MAETMNHFEIIGRVVAYGAAGYFGCGMVLMVVWMLPVVLMRGLRRNITAQNVAMAIIAWPLAIVEEWRARVVGRPGRKPGGETEHGST